MKNDKTQFTQRVLASLVNDLANLMEAAERLRIQIAALAGHHGVEMPAAE